MLKIVDEDRKIRYVLRDEDEEPKDIEEIVLEDDSAEEDSGKEEEDGRTDV